GMDEHVLASALERSGIGGLNEGQNVTFELQTDRRTGKTSAVDLRVAA
ncbi:MAG: cold-shock protein, partial [Bauldia sp.]|nr:cold-shock protein [Bauldia sp.]